MSRWVEAGMGNCAQLAAQHPRGSPLPRLKLSEGGCFPVSAPRPLPTSTPSPATLSARRATPGREAAERAGKWSGSGGGGAQLARGRRRRDAAGRKGEKEGPRAPATSRSPGPAGECGAEKGDLNPSGS